MAQTANDALYAAAVRHHVHLLRFAEGQAKQAGKILKATEGELLEKISGAMAKGLDATRLESLLASVKKLRAEVYAQIGKDTTEALMGLTEAEAAWETAALQGASPIQLNLATVPAEKLHAAVTAPIAGIPLEGWLDDIKDKEARQLQAAVTQAVLQGETIDDLVRRIRGTKAGNYMDGILGVSTRNAQALARTAVNHVSNSARNEVWLANADIVRALRWTSTLDGRTSTICQSRDGHMTPIGESSLLPGDQPLVPAGAKPPAHFNCRSLFVPVMDGDEIAGDRPFVADPDTRAKRESRFRAEAKERGVSIQQVRKDWADKHVGRVPAATTYSQWLKKQPASFQDEVLGKGKADLFRSGVALERFVDKSGKVLTLAELKAELAGDALNVLQPAIGLKAKGLLMQGLAPDEVLSAIKVEFPDAKTTAASIASYKSELKKAGLLDPLASPKSAQKYLSLNTAGQLNLLEAQLPVGLKNAVQGQWATVVDELEGHPGAYAHYKPGVGVQLSDQKLTGLSKAQVQQVMAHELGHMLNKQHGFGVFDLMDPDLKDPFASVEDWGQSLALKAIDMPPELKKLYGYYIHSQDELVAEIIGQAIHPSPVTSQGMAAGQFVEHFAEQIANAKKAVMAKFPDAPPAPQTGPVVAGMGEIAGKPTSIGAYAKSLLQQGMADQAVLDAVLAEFPAAKTTMNSIKSYKSELKKVEQASIGKPGPAIAAKTHPQVDPEAPQDAPAPPGVSDPAAELPKPQTGSIPLGGLAKIGGKPGGTNPGAVFKDAKGDDWLVKGNIQKVNGSVTAEVSDARAMNEVLTARLLREADPTIAPEMKLVDLEGQFGGGLGVASKMLDKPMVKFDVNNKAHVKAAQKDFALHAWLGNWDVVGAEFDNLVMKHGKAVNIDPGGALLFRAQGMQKDSFTADAGDFHTMRQATKNAQAAKVYGSMTDAELAVSAQALLKFTDEVIDKHVAAMNPGMLLGKSNLAEILQMRRDAILKQVGLKMPQKPVVPPTFDAPKLDMPSLASLPDDALEDLETFIQTQAKVETDAKFFTDGYIANQINKNHGFHDDELITAAEVAEYKAWKKAKDPASPAAPVAVAPAKVVDFKKMSPQELADALIPNTLSSAVTQWTGKTTASWKIQQAAAELFKAGVKTETVQAALLLKFPDKFVPKLNSLASMKSKLKKQGLLEGPPKLVGEIEQAIPTPVLWGQSLGSKSSGVKEQAKLLIGSGKPADEVVAWITSQFSSPNPGGAANLYELAYYEVKTGKVFAKPGVAAVAKKAPAWSTLETPVPLRPATKPGEAGPPPPRFTAEHRRTGLARYGGLGHASSNLVEKINKKQKAAGLEELEQEELDAIKAYTNSAYATVNSKLRGGHFASDVHLQAWTDAAMAGLRKMPKWEGKVVRGMTVSASEVAQLKQFYRPGAIVEENAFISTSDHEKGSGFGGNVRYEIKVKSGTDVRAISSHGGEQEILLAPGMKFRVLSVEPYSGPYGGQNGMKITMEEV